MMTSLTTMRKLSVFPCWMMALVATPALGFFVCKDHLECLPNGDCGADFTCECYPGYAGTLCQESCPLPCQNGGRCQLVDEDAGEESGFYCDCPSTHTGGLCEDENLTGEGVSCPLDCMNGGECIVSDGPDGTLMEFYCQCPSNYIGSLCQQVRNAGDGPGCPIDCKNGGECKLVESHDGVENEFYCDCPSNYTGNACQRLRSEPGAPSSSSTPEAVTASDRDASRAIGITVGIGVALVALSVLFECWRRRCRHRGDADEKQLAFSSSTSEPPPDKNAAQNDPEEAEIQDLPPIA